MKRGTMKRTYLYFGAFTNENVDIVYVYELNHFTSGCISFSTIRCSRMWYARLYVFPTL